MEITNKKDIIKEGKTNKKTRDKKKQLPEKNLLY